MRNVWHSCGRAILPILFGCVSGALHAAPVVLTVRPLHDFGGVAPELPGRLTTALTRFLRDHADPSVRVEMAGGCDAVGKRDASARYVLEGDLSYASGTGEESGRYMLVARLAREGRATAPIGQWAGSASSLRYLTANLRRDPRVDTLGLIGEIGSRVLTALTSEAAGPGPQWLALASALNPLRAPKATIVQADAPHAVRKEAVGGGDTFRVCLQARAPVRAYLLTFGNDGQLRAVLLIQVVREALPPRATRIYSQALRLPPGTIDAWLLCRSITTAADTSVLPCMGRSARLCTFHADEDDAPVHVLNGVGGGAALRDETLTPLLEEIARDSHSWRVLHLRVATPHK